MRYLKTGAWRPPPVSKYDLGVGTPPVVAERVRFLLLSGRSLFFVLASPLFLSEAQGIFIIF